MISLLRTDQFLRIVYKTAVLTYKLQDNHSVSNKNRTFIYPIILIRQLLRSSFTNYLEFPELAQTVDSVPELQVERFVSRSLSSMEQFVTSFQPHCFCSLFSPVFQIHHFSSDSLAVTLNPDVIKPSSIAVTKTCFRCQLSERQHVSPTVADVLFQRTVCTQLFDNSVGRGINTRLGTVPYSLNCCKTLVLLI